VGRYVHIHPAVKRYGPSCAAGISIAALVLLRQWLHLSNSKIRRPVKFPATSQARRRVPGTLYRCWATSPAQRRKRVPPRKSARRIRGGRPRRCQPAARSRGLPRQSGGV